METWKEVRDFVIENFDGTYDSDTNTVKALLGVNRDRTQCVEITRIGDIVVAGVKLPKNAGEKFPLLGI